MVTYTADASVAGLPLMLSVIKCGVRIASRINGFLVAEPTSTLPLVDGPLINYDCQSGYTPEEMAELLSTTLQLQHDQGNPVIAQYMTVLERVVTSTNVPMLSEGECFNVLAVDQEQMKGQSLLLCLTPIS